MTITTKENAQGKISGYYVDGQRVKKNEINELIQAAAREGNIITVDYYTAQAFRAITHTPYSNLKAVFTNYYDLNLMTEAAARELGATIIKRFTGFDGWLKVYSVEMPTTNEPSDVQDDTNIDEYAVSTDAQDAAIDAEIELANNTTALVPVEFYAEHEGYLLTIMTKARLAVINEQNAEAQRKIRAEQAAKFKAEEEAAQAAAIRSGNYKTTINKATVTFKNHKIVAIDEGYYHFEERISATTGNLIKRFYYEDTSTGRLAKKTVSAKRIIEDYINDERAAEQENIFPAYFKPYQSNKATEFAVSVILTYANGREHHFYGEFDQYRLAKKFIEDTKAFAEANNTPCQFFTKTKDHSNDRKPVWVDPHQYECTGNLKQHRLYYSNFNQGNEDTDTEIELANNTIALVPVEFYNLDDIANLIPSVNAFDQPDDELIDTPDVTETVIEEKIDDFAAQLAALKAERDAAEADFELKISARKAAEKAEDLAADTFNHANRAYEKFGNDKAKELRQALLTDDIIRAEDLTCTTQSGVSVKSPFSQIMITFQGGKFKISAMYDTLATYDTPEQVTAAINQLKDAIKRGDEQFKFPTVEEINQQAKHTELDVDDYAVSTEAQDAEIENAKAETTKHGEDDTGGETQAPIIQNENAIDAPIANDLSDSLVRAMKIALEKSQEFCRAKDFRNVQNEMKLYTICAKALTEFMKGGVDGGDGGDGGDTDDTDKPINQTATPPDAKAIWERVVATRKRGLNHVLTKNGRHMWFYHGALIDKITSEIFLRKDGFTLDEFLEAEKIADEYWDEGILTKERG